MPCYYPVSAWRTNTINPETGKRGITFSRAKAIVDMPLELPCGKCMGCRINKSIQWALRCVHESQLHEQNCFITLTYDDEHIPPGGTLVKKHFQDFMKRLRREISPLKVRYYMCGEYGEQLQRPHYHALLFGYDFDDKEVFKYRPKSILYTSQKLQELWPHGFTSLGALTYETAAYTAKYATKKIYGKEAEQYYGGRQPEYSSMSLKPGIGQGYFDLFQDELYQHDHVVRNGRKFPLPRFYTQKFTEEQQAELKLQRQKNSDPTEHTIERLRVRETVKAGKLKFFNREI